MAPPTRQAVSQSMGKPQVSLPPSLFKNPWSLEPAPAQLAAEGPGPKLPSHLLPHPPLSKKTEKLKKLLHSRWVQVVPASRQAHRTKQGPLFPAFLPSARPRAAPPGHLRGHPALGDLQPLAPELPGRARKLYPSCPRPAPGQHTGWRRQAAPALFEAWDRGSPSLSTFPTPT